MTAPIPDTYPAHVAIVMDGNGRWAQGRGRARSEGHRSGLDPVRMVIEECLACGIPALTLYAFSSENWRRPAGEVMDLTGLLRRYLRSEIAELKQSACRLMIFSISPRPRKRANLSRKELKPAI